MTSPEPPRPPVAWGRWLAWVALYHLADAVQAVCAFLLRCYRITLAPLLIYTALLWGLGLYGGYRLAYTGLPTLGWQAQPGVGTFWITSTVALAWVSVLFAWLAWRASAASLQHQPK